MDTGFGGVAGADGFPASSMPVTPYRKTLLRMDVAEFHMTESPFGMTCESGQMSKSHEAQVGTHDVFLIPGEGWELKALNLTDGYQHERTELASSVINLTVPSGFGTMEVFRQPSDQPGALTGANANLATTGDRFYGKRVASGTSLDDASKYRLAADQTSFPGPRTGNDNLAMDRVGVSTENHDPNQGFFIRLIIAGHRVSAPDKLFGVYFVGPAGWDRYHKGFGQFHLSLAGSGQAALWEKVTTIATNAIEWVFRAALRFCEPQRASNGAHRLYIRPVAYTSPRSGCSGTIHFFTEAQDSSQGYGILSAGSMAGDSVNVATYRSPATAGLANTSVTPWRFDQRRDHRHQFQPAKPVFPDSGVLRCDAFGVDGFFFSNVAIKVFWWGSAPAGTSVDIKIYDALTDVELPTTASGSIVQGGRVVGGSRDCTTTYPQRQYYVKITLHSDGSSTPIVSTYSINRDGFAEDIDPGEVTTKVLNVSIVGADGDPTHETASVSVKDPFGNLAILSERGTIPCVIETQYDKDDPTKKIVLFHGYIQKAESTRIGTKMPVALGSATLSAFAQNWKRYELQMIGAWQKLSQSRIPFRWYFGYDKDGGAPKVSDITRQAFYFAGIVPEQVDVPNDSLPFFGSPDGRESFVLAPLAPLDDFIQHLTRNYAGKWISWDPNAQMPGSGVDRGMWRIRPQNKPDGEGNYNTLAHFHTDSATDANKLAAFAVPHYQGSYPVETVGGRSDIVHTFVRRGTLRTHTRPPEANLICVTGTGLGVFNVGQAVSNDQMTVTLANPRSYNFAGLTSGDPNYPNRDDPDYLPYVVPYLIADPYLQTPEAVAFVARRIYERVGHGSKIVILTAPLISVTDAEDSYQIRPRKLGFYDAVKIDGFDFYCRSCSPSYFKDRIQMATYEFEQCNGVLY